MPLSPLTPLEHPLSLYPFCVSSLLHPLSSPSYDSFGSDLLDDPFTTILPPPASFQPILHDLQLTRQYSFFFTRVFDFIYIYIFLI